MKPRWLLPRSLNAWQARALKHLRANAPVIKDMVWVLSSGTESVNRLKCIGLERSALDASAAAVNRHLRAGPGDRWLTALPLYHVGGFSIALRARLAGAAVVRLRGWDPRRFARALEKNKITLVSLVPTQVYDLVEGGFCAPDALRAVVVGGGAVAPALYRRARALGWPVLPSYGLTETGSMVATAPLASLAREGYPDLKVLTHARIELDPNDGRIKIRSRSLCRLIATSDGESFTLEDPAPTGWYGTADLGAWGQGGLRVLGRRDDVVKVLGVLVSLPQIEAELRDRLGACAVLSVPDERAGHRVLAIVDGAENIVERERALAAYNARAMGPWRVSQLCWVDRLPRTALGKLKKSELRLKLGLG